MDIGDEAPDFELPDEAGTLRRLSEMLVDGPVVLYFYPAAMTPGCTAESCHFRDLSEEFAGLGAQRVGVSADPVERQKEFSERYSFDFPLLSDTDGSVARAYGVRRNFGPLPTRRTTFVIGRDRRILDIVRSEVRMSKHADQALATLRSLPSA
jgi:peroxiredoxin Q/BCP